MKFLFLLALFAGAIFFLGPPADGQALPSEVPADAGKGSVEIKLEEMPARLAAIDQELARDLNTYLAVVDKEAKAKRLSNAYAASLRWSGKTAVEGSFSVANRSLITTARTPSTIRAVTEAREILDTAATGLAAERLAILTAVAHGLRRRIAEAAQGHPTASELKTLGEQIDAMHEVAFSHAVTLTPEESHFNQASNSVHWLEHLLEAEASHDPAQLREALPLDVSVGEFLPDAERKAWTTQALEPFVAEVETAQTALDAALEARKPLAERESAMARLEQAAERMNSLATKGRYLPEAESARSSVSAYRLMLKALAAIEAGDAHAVSVAFAQVRMGTENGGPWTARIKARINQWESEMGESSRRNDQERITKLRTQLTAVKTPADLEAIIEQLAGQQSAAPRQEGDNRENFESLKQQLAFYSTAWSGGNPAALQQERFGYSPGSALFSNEVAALRKIIERDLLVRALHAPELNRAPLADLPPEAALEKLEGDLASHNEWRRLAQLAQARIGNSMGGAEIAGQQDLLAALQSFLAGQNFEGAEQWTDAVAAYKAVLRSTSDLAPTAAAAERLKALTKAHPETNTPAANPPAAASFQPLKR